MARKLNGLSQRYVAALRKHLKQGPRASPAARDGASIGTPGHGPGAGDAGSGPVSRAGADYPGVAGLLPRHPGPDDPAGGNFFCRGHHPDRENASHGAGGQRPFESNDRDVEPAHRGSGRLEPAVATGNRSSASRWRSPSERASNITASCWSNRGTCRNSCGSCPARFCPPRRKSARRSAANCMMSSPRP